jgi:hypothetical protein
MFIGSKLQPAGYLLSSHRQAIIGWLKEFADKNPNVSLAILWFRLTAISIINLHLAGAYWRRAQNIL